jgi:hypothetical protein
MPLSVVDSDEKSSLSYSESVTYARVCAGDERHQIAKKARDSFDGFWNLFPTFWSADKQAQLKKLNLHRCARTCMRKYRDQGKRITLT